MNLMNMLILLFSLTSNLFAAPHPTTGSSAVNFIQNNTVFSQLGFKLTYLPTDWKLAADSDQSGSESKMITVQKQNSFINFEIEETKTVVDLEKFVRRYLKDYNQFGFELSEQESHKDEKKTYIVLEAFQKNKKTKTRQFFFQNVKKIATITCIGEFEHFDKTKQVCNSIVNSLVWN